METQKAEEGSLTFPQINTPHPYFFFQCFYVVNSDLMQQDGCKTQDSRMTYKMRSLAPHFFVRHSAVLSLTAVLLRKLPIKMDMEEAKRLVLVLACKKKFR